MVTSSPDPAGQDAAAKFETGAVDGVAVSSTLSEPLPGASVSSGAAADVADLRIRVGGVELAVRVSGPPQGVPVIVLHGFTGSASAMAPLTDRLAGAFQAADESERPLRLVVPDLVGHGVSEAPSDPSAYRVESMAGQVVALADALGCETFHLVGYSMGGRVALTLGCRSPRRLRSLALIGATAGIADPDERRRRAGDDSARADRITADFSAFVDDWMNDPLFAGQAALGDVYLRAARAQRMASNPDGLARSLRHGGTGSMTPLHGEMGRCEAPTMLVVGLADTKFCAIAEELADGLPQALVARMAGAGHAAHVERPSHTAAMIAASIAAAEENLDTAGGYLGALGANLGAPGGSPGAPRGDLGAAGRDLGAAGGDMDAVDEQADTAGEAGQCR